MKIIPISLLIFFISFNAQATRIDANEGELFSPLQSGQIRNCSTTQAAMVNDANTAVGQRLDEIQSAWPQVNLPGVKRDFINPENRIWIPGNPNHMLYQNYWTDMSNVFRLMKGEHNNGVNYECRDNSNSTCKDVYAYVLFILGHPRKIIYLCPIFFQTDHESQSETIMHELSHYAALTEDYAGDWWSINNINLKRGAADAYHIERFMHEDTNYILRSLIWLWWWPKPKPSPILVY